MVLFCISSFSQCPNYSIRGPRVLCGEPPYSFTYHVQVQTTGIGSWYILPAGAANISSQGSIGDDRWVEVKWLINPFPPTTSTTQLLALVFFDGTCSDTIYMQDCCTPDPGDEIIITDFTSRDLSPLEAETPLGGTWNSSTSTILIEPALGSTRRQVFIEGELDVMRTTYGDITLEFNDCDIFMGPGAVLYGTGFVFKNCIVQGRCGMWQGINVRTHGLIEATDVNFSDAEYCISIFDVELWLRLKNVQFTRNFVSIYAPATTVENSFKYSIIPSHSSIIEDCLFEGLPLITLPPYFGQWGIPQGQKSFAGMLLNNLTAPVLQGSPFDRIYLIPFSNDPAYQNYFRQINFGIYAINSHIEVFNCTFIRVQPEPAYVLSRRDIGGIGIYSKGIIGTSPRLLNVGDENDAARALNFQNIFEDCHRGIVTLNRINSKINKNYFLHTSSSIFKSGLDVYLKDADQSSISIRENIFEERNVQLSNAGPYPSTGIVVSSIAPTIKILHIDSNEFFNKKVGIFVQNTKGRSYSDARFLIENNDFTTDVSPNQLSTYGAIFGIWLSNSSNGVIRYNNMMRPVPLNAEPSNYENMVYGMNIVGSTNMNIAANDITQYGTSFRMVSNCNGTTLKCNDIIANVQGISLANAGMTSQGYSGEAWDNKWDGFPTPSMTTYNRAKGSATSLISWYNQGQPNDISVNNRYSPEPVENAIIYPHAYENTAGCYVNSPYPGDVESRRSRITKIIEGEMEYLRFPEESSYLDQEYVYYALREDTVLLNSNPDFKEYLDSLESIEFGYFDEVDEMYEYGEIMDALAVLGLMPQGTVIDEYKNFTREIFLSQKFSDNDNLDSEIEDQLHEIAWTNAWEGGSGVFSARHLLEEQVFDLENNLRTRKPIKNNNKTSINENSSFSVYPNPTKESITLFYTSDPASSLEVILTDLTGRVLFERSIISNKLDISSVPDGIYILSLKVDYQIAAKTKIVVLN